MEIYNLKNKFIVLSKIMLTVFLLMYAFYSIELDHKSFSEILRNELFIFVFFIITLSVIIQNILHSLRFMVSAKIHQISINFIDSFKIIHIAGFVGFSPIGIVGYEMIRINYLIKLTNYKKSLLIIYFDRLIGLIALIFISYLAYLLIIKKSFYLIDIHYGKTINLVILIGIIFFIFLNIIPIKNFSSQIKNIKIRLLFEEAILFFKADKIINGKLILVSLIMALIVPISIALSTLLLNFETPFIIFFAISCIGTLISVVPITLGGFGLRESAFIFLAYIFNYSQQEALIISILFSLSLFVGYLPGFFFIFFNKNSKRKN